MKIWLICSRIKNRLGSSKKRRVGSVLTDVFLASADGRTEATSEVILPDFAGYYITGVGVRVFSEP